MKKEMIVLAVGLFLLFSFVQMHFLSYYNVFGIPFGKVDVDVYMHSINEADFDLDHLLVTVLPYTLAGVIDPALLYTVSIPFFACIILPFTMFMFAYYFSKDYTVSFLSVFFMLFGTFTLQAYLISALWAQMFATIFAMWTIMFIRHYTETRDKSMLGFILLSIILTALSHPAGLGIIVVFAGITIYAYSTHKMLVGGVSMVVTGLVLFAIQIFTNMFGDYLYSVDLSYAFNVFASPFLWLIVPMGIAISINNEKERFIAVAFLVVALVSPMFVLWRPLVSVLPLVAYFSARFVAAFLRMYDDFLFRNFQVLVIVLVIVAILFIYISAVTNDFMTSMLWEMEAEPGIVDILPRAVNSTIMRDMYFGGIHECYGVLDEMGNNLTERCY